MDPIKNTYFLIHERRTRMERKMSPTPSTLAGDFGNRATATVFNFLRSTLRPKRNLFEKGTRGDFHVHSCSSPSHNVLTDDAMITLCVFRDTDGFQLDLQYVHDRVLVMAFPSDQTLNALAVNRISEVARFLELSVGDGLPR